jgi:hypothetical protein
MFLQQGFLDFTRQQLLLHNACHCDASASQKAFFKMNGRELDLASGWFEPCAGLERESTWGSCSPGFCIANQHKFIQTLPRSVT